MVYITYATHKNTLRTKLLKNKRGTKLSLGQVQKLKRTSLHFIYPEMVHTLKVHISTQSAILKISTF